MAKIIKEVKVACEKCGSTNTFPAGFDITTEHYRQRWECRDCKHTWWVIKK